MANLSDDERRTQAVAMLRAVADLIESRPDLPVPRCAVDFSVPTHGIPDVSAAVAAITSAFPGPWTAAIRRNRDYSWLTLDSGAALLEPGVRVHVAADADQVCTQAGEKTITTWKPVPEIAALIESGEAELDA